MKSTVEHLEPTKIKMTVEVAYDELKPSVDAAFKEFAKQINIPGFRPGKAPARVIEQRIGRGPVLEEAINNALPGFFAQAVEENNLVPMGRPEVDVTKTPNMEGAAGGELAFDATVEVRPEFELPELSSLNVEVEKASVSEEDVTTELDGLRKRFASLKTVERAVGKDDFVVIDMVAKVDGEEVDNVSQVSYQIGSGTMLDGMDEALTGMTADQTKTFNTKLAGGSHAGQDAEVTVTVSSVKVQELPEADDEFAQMVSEHDTIGELTDDIKESLEKRAAADQAVQARDRLLEAIVEKVDFPLPGGVIEENLNMRTSEDSSEEEKKEARGQIEDSLRRQIVMDKLAEDTQVGVSQEELLEFVLQSAQAYGIDPSAFLSSAEQQGRLPGFIQEIARNKALAQSLRAVSVKDTDGNEVDLTEFIGTDEDDEDSQGESQEQTSQEANNN